MYINLTRTEKVNREEAAALLEEQRQELVEAVQGLEALKARVVALRQTVKDIGGGLGCSPSSGETKDGRARFGVNLAKIRRHLEEHGPATVSELRAALGMADSSVRVTIKRHGEVFKWDSSGRVDVARKAE